MKPKRPARAPRAVIGGSKKGPPIIEIDAADITPEGIRAAFVERFGPECAAWLVSRFRKTIRIYGCFPMHLEAGKEEPPWFQIAIAFLKKREAKWTVTERVERGVRKYRVIWKARASAAPAPDYWKRAN